MASQIPKLKELSVDWFNYADAHVFYNVNKPFLDAISQLGGEAGQEFATTIIHMANKVDDACKEYIKSEQEDDHTPTPQEIKSFISTFALKQKTPPERDGLKKLGEALNTMWKTATEQEKATLHAAVTDLLNTQVSRELKQRR